MARLALKVKATKKQKYKTIQDVQNMFQRFS